MKIKILEKSILIGLIISFLLNLTIFSAQCENISEKVLRLHILANSDSSEDQNLKIKVRDKILEYSPDIFSNVYNKETAKCIISQNLHHIKEIAENEIKSNGYIYNVNLEITKMHFNTRKYKEITLPAGNYEALRITIGEGKGHNWWCVMFPPMCIPIASEKKELSDVLNQSELELVENEEKYEIKFKIIELFEEIKNLFPEESDDKIEN